MFYEYSVNYDANKDFKGVSNDDLRRGDPNAWAAAWPAGESNRGGEEAHFRAGRRHRRAGRLLGEGQKGSFHRGNEYSGPEGHRQSRSGRVGGGRVNGRLDCC